MSEKQRLDMLLVQRGLESSRERAKAVIMSGIVYVNNQKVDKAGFFCSPEDQVEAVSYTHLDVYKRQIPAITISL